MRRLFFYSIVLLISLLFFNLTNAQELAPQSQQKKYKINEGFEFNHQQEAGEILYSIQLINDRDPLGVTIINSIIYITSSDGSGNNYWDKYSLDGTHLGSVVQGTSSSYGYRDLAYDGTNILASDDNDIDKIDPNTFAIVSTITNMEHSPHRGLAYDPNENAIYSTNFRTGPCIKIDAATGALIKELKKPNEAPYGIAIDRFTYPDYASLWYAEPTAYGTFRISRVDTTIGNINFSFDLSAELPDSSLSGGLEIINNHPNYPGKIIAVAVDQNSNQLIFIDITDAPEILPGSLEEVAEFGGWDAEGIITYGMVQHSDYLYATNNGDLSIYEIASNPEAPSFIKTITIGGGNKIFLHNDLLFISNGNPNPNSFSIYQLTDPLNPTLMSTIDTGNPIIDMEFDGDYAFVIQINIPQMTVYNISDLGNPQQHDVYNLVTPCTDLTINNSRKILFIGYSSGGSSNNGIELIDISNMNAIQQLDNQSTNFDRPQSTVVIDDEYLAVIVNSQDDDDCKIITYNYSNSSDINFVDLHFASFDNGGWDLILMDDILIVTIPGEGIQTFYWDAAIQTFLFGPALAQPEPLNLTSYFPPTTSMANIKSNNNNIMFDAEVAYLYETNGLASGYYSNGSLPNKVIQVRKPGYNTIERVMLEISVSPSEAATAGCSTTPAPGTHEYDKNTTVNISAVEADGWIFNYWQGASGGMNTSILMDEYKNVTAVFTIVTPDKVLLSMSISPAQAATDGCSTLPAVGPHEYDPNATVDLSAQEANGWVFLEWQGASGGNPTSIVMDEDKEVTAVFQPTLTVSGNNKKVISCISDQKDSLRELGVVNFCASEADDWVLHGFSLNGSGTGNEVAHIQNVAAVVNDNVSEAAVFWNDDGLVSLDFIVPITIPRGNCINVTIVYLMDEIPEEDYIDKSSLTFQYRTSFVDAFPVNYTPGIIIGNGENENFILAKVYNDDMEIFSTIQEAIDNTNSIIDNPDTKEIYVCCGDYEETLSINKIISLKAVESKIIDKKSNIISDGIDNVLMNITGEFVFFDDFTFQTNNTDAFYSFKDSTSVNFTNCNFIMSNGHKLVFNINGVFDAVFDNCIVENGKQIINAHNGYSIELNNVKLETERLNNPAEEWNIDISDFHEVRFDNVSTGSGNSNMNLKIENTEFSLINTFISNFPTSNKTLSKILLINAPYSELSSIREASLEMINCNNSKVELSDLYNVNIINSSDVTIKNNNIGRSNYYALTTPEYAVSIIKSNIFGSGNIPMTNVKLLNNTFDVTKNGVYALNQSNLKINENRGWQDTGFLADNSNYKGIYCDGGTNLEIKLNKFDFGKNGIHIENGEHVKIIENEIKNTKRDGILIRKSNYGYVGNNTFYKNFWNVMMCSAKDFSIANSNILKAAGINTGISIDSSKGLKLEFNNILNNNGDGIHISGNSEVDLEQNNISGNSGDQLENAGSNLITAQNNFWGNTSGPEPNDIVGNVDASNWLQESVGLVVTLEQDTLHLIKGEEDSVTIFTNNISDYSDIYNVTITETQDWINSEIEFNNIQADTNGTAIKLKITIPEESTESNKITVNLTSQTNEKTTSVDFYIFPYSIEIKELYLSPDSISLALGDSLRFNAVGIDQYGNAISLSPQWSTDNGTIDNAGLYKANDTTGNASIIATDSESGLTENSVLLVTNTAPILNSITLEPDSVKLKFGESYQFNISSNDQFGNSIMFYPIWAATGGTISSAGIYVADSTNGIYFVKLEASETNLYDSSVVIVENTIVNVKEIIPTEFSLYQNYPNPFNPSTTIRFGLKEEGYVKLEIFNILGERIALPINKNIKAGTHNVNVNFDGFSSGVYFYRIDVKGKFTDVKKMLLLK